MEKHFKSYKYALKGILEVSQKHLNFKIELMVAILVTIMGFIFKLNSSEWVSLVLIITLVFVTEAINTAIEEACNAVDVNHNEHIRVAKDVAAGAVLIAAFASIIIGALIFLPHIISF